MPNEPRKLIHLHSSDDELGNALDEPQPNALR
jgi:hypothetical protein